MVTGSGIHPGGFGSSVDGAGSGLGDGGTTGAGLGLVTRTGFATGTGFAGTTGLTGGFEADGGAAALVFVATGVTATGDGEVSACVGDANAGVSDVVASCVGGADVTTAAGVVG